MSQCKINIRSIVREYLVMHGYDGLAYCEDWDGCGCGLDDLICCDEWCRNCRPAYAVHWDTCTTRQSDGGCYCAYETKPLTDCTCYSVDKPGGAE